ncbi:alpha/beta hydrolase [Kurthia massiliensis]|uniref:alpha/beta hydrolase n=1 Tax=Kurthia massiliensis TaxID=1033739 RepID=UPI00028900EE|nr:alpha/beta hydrolase [Kurthia massiliensis]
MNYAMYGDKQAQEVIVAIPALGERKEMFLPLVAQLPTYRWLVFDLPGSHLKKEAASVDHFCKWIQHVLMKEQVTVAHFIGSSIGAWIIQAFTARYPALVQSLVLLDGGHYFQEGAYEEVSLATGTAQVEKIEAAIHELTYAMPHLTKEAYVQFYDYFLQNYVLYEGEYVHHCDEAAYHQLSKDVTVYNYCLPTFDVPTLLMIAASSADEESINHARRLAAKCEQVKLQGRPKKIYTIHFEAKRS